MDRKKKGKYVGLAGALLVHVVVIALLILVGFTLPEQSEEGGVPVMMGEVPDAWGAADPSLVEVDVMPEETAPEMPEEVEQDMLTQEEEETVAIKPKAEEKRKKRRSRRRPQRKKQRRPESWLPRKRNVNGRLRRKLPANVLREPLARVRRWEVRALRKGKVCKEALPEILPPERLPEPGDMELLILADVL